jgi:hypothetical protein
VVGRLYYHTAQCLLAQINPILPKESEEARAAQKHHAHQVCGIVAHTKDNGVASVSIRSLALVAEVLNDRPEQQEVIDILERIDRETGWKLGGVLSSLKRAWGWEKTGGTGLAAQFLPPHNKHAASPSGVGVNMQLNRLSTTQTTTPPQQQHPLVTSPSAHAAAQQLRPTPPMAAPRPMRVNPLSFADFSLPNHPYQNWYEPPSRSNLYSSQGLS